ncbi:hypothetical protein S245_012450 [Arachis hypogaea]|nr:uncharacterized protein DS421_4g116570 [Arachis hypogaea]
MKFVVKYERLGCFRNYCGHLGHEQRVCSVMLHDTANGGVKEKRWGSWLKAEQTNRRLNKEKENNNPNRPKNDPVQSDKFHRPIPVSLLGSFVKLSMEKKGRLIM